MTDSRLSPRRFGLDDVLQLETFIDSQASPVAFAPDGRRLVFAVTGPSGSASGFGRTFLLGRERSRLYLVELPNGRPRQLGSGRWGSSTPLWSPNGTSIAVVASDGRSIRPCVIDPSSGAEIFPTELNLVCSWGRPDLTWISDNLLACRVLPAGVAPSAIDVQVAAAQTAMTRWPLAWNGSVATASALRTGDPDHAEPDGIIAVCDLSSASCRLESAPEAVQAFRNAPQTKTAVGPAVDGDVLAKHPASGQQVRLCQDETGTRLRLNVSQGSASDRTLFETNGFLAAIDPGPLVDLAFTSRRGRKLTMQCVLPPGNVRGRPVPTILEVYPGARASRLVCEQHRITSPYLLNPQLFAAHGYAVAVPPLPFFDGSERSDIIAAMVDCVEPAVAELVAAGIAVHDDIHLIGHSMGGWAVACLLAKTRLFRSGIANAGIYDLLSLAGQFDVRRTHLKGFDPVCRNLVGCWHIDTAPHIDPKPYLEASPILMADAVSAPLLLMHGDLDYVPIQQSEEMFSALRLAGKEAEFVRYWGEDHLPSSPANMRDLWERVLKWLVDRRATGGDKRDALKGALQPFGPENRVA